MVSGRNNPESPSCFHKTRPRCLDRGACCHSPGSEIGDNAVVAAGAAVSKDVEANTIVGGVHAKFVRYITPDFIPPYFAGATFDASIPGV